MARVSNIPGYDGFIPEADEMESENPFGIQVYFKVVSEIMPAESKTVGKTVRRNFIWIYKKMDLGRSVVSRRIRDKVHFDEASSSWKIDDFAAVSDIKKYPAQWREFVQGARDNLVGTPIEDLFPGDPSKVEEYKRYGIIFIEQLAVLNDQNASEIMLDGLNNKRKAGLYLARAEKEAPARIMQESLNEKEQKISTLQNQVNELSSRLTELLQALEGKDLTPSKRGRPAKTEASIEQPSTI